MARSPGRPRKRRVERGLPQLRERPGQLHAGRAAPHDREVHILARAANVQPLQPGHDVVPQRHRVPPRIQPEAVLGRPRHPVVRRRHPRRQDQVVVLELPSVGQRDPPLDGIDPGQLPQPEPHTLPARKRPRRVHHIARIQPGRRHLVQQRLERAVPVVIDQHHLHPRPRQLSHRRQPGKPRTNNDHPRRISPRHPAPAPPHTASPSQRAPQLPAHKASTAPAL